MALLDADNLVSENWLVIGVETLRAHDEDVIIHPDYVIGFGARDFIWKQVSSLDANFDPYAIILFNYWDTVCIARKEILEQVPHDPARPSEGFGYEDWHWNLETLAKNIEHCVAPETVFFYRIKSVGSRLSIYEESATLPPMSSFLEPAIIDRYQERHKRIKAPIIEQPIQIQPEAQPEPEGSNSSRKTVRAALLYTIRKISYTLYSFARLFFRLHHRLRIFEQEVYPAVHNLLKPPGNPPAKDPDTTKRNIKAQSESLELPDWLLREWKRMHAIDPAIFPDAHKIMPMHEHIIKSDLYVSVYWKTARKLSKELDYLFLVPWLRKGGADLEVINYIKAIKEVRPTAKIAVLATSNTPSPWSKLLPEDVVFVSVDTDFHKLNPSQQEHLLGQLMVQLQPKRIHLINSSHGYRSLEKYAKAVSKHTKIYLLIFCLDHTEQGKRVHYVIDYLESMIDYITMVFADNQNVFDELINLYGYSDEKFSVHYQPFDYVAPKISKTERKPITNKRPLKLLWAGRMDWQKRPDILIELAKQIELQNLPVEIHAYGSAVLNSKKYLRRLKSQSNIIYHGPYDNGLLTLPVSTYDMFLMTSEWEGMPNVLLEATAGQLPVISSKVGGIPEFISHHSTGYLVDPYDDVGEYISVIKEVIHDPSKAQLYNKAALKLMTRRHSWKNFIRQIISEGYCD
jgi:glycosyltransferase involved in cell wall biosynthesis